MVTRWIVDGNNVVGARPDGWWNDRERAMTRLTQRIAVWCRTHEDAVTLVFDPPAAPGALGLGGGNLAVEEAPRHGRDAADDRIAELAAATAAGEHVVVVSSDRGLRARLPAHVEVFGAARFRDLIEGGAG